MAFIVRSSLHHLAFKFCIWRNGKVICQIFFVDVCTFLCCSCYCCCCCCCCSCCFKNRGITQHVLITFHVWIKLCFRSVLARQVTRSALRLLVQPPAQGLKEPVIFNGSVWSRVKWSAYHIGDSLGYIEQEQWLEWLLTKKLLMWGLGSNAFARMKNFNPQFKRSLRRRPFLLHLSFTFSFIMIHLMCLSHSHLLYCYLSLSLSVIHIFSLSL